MKRQEPTLELTLRPVHPGEALFGFERDDATSSESDSQRPQLRYAPSDPQGVVLLGRRGDQWMRLGVALLWPVEDAHALAEGEFYLGEIDPERRARYQARMLDALVVLAKTTGSRRLRLRLGQDELSVGPWARCLQTPPAVRRGPACTTIEFPIAAYFGGATRPEPVRSWPSAA